jgi:hypothetical protein
MYIPIAYVSGNMAIEVLGDAKIYDPAQRQCGGLKWDTPWHQGHEPGAADAEAPAQGGDLDE